ncbi:hypothetical protein ABID08_002194 [Rhizobium binae]|uniref:CopG family transcriptional regulator n=1 Tax=Rhizobium binae TaxID=1138190 RepID=A0ABV2MEE7_9HYPH
MARHLTRRCREPNRGHFSAGPANHSSRAALLVRNAGSIALDDDTEEALRNVPSELVLTREDAIRYIVREWMEQNTYLPVHELDEDGQVDGTA